jgi:hypothetical protein
MPSLEFTPGAPATPVADQASVWLEVALVPVSIKLAVTERPTIVAPGRDRARKGGRYRGSVVYVRQQLYAVCEAWNYDAEKQRQNPQSVCTDILKVDPLLP